MVMKEILLVKGNGEGHLGAPSISSGCFSEARILFSYLFHSDSRMNRFDLGIFRMPPGFFFPLLKIPGPRRRLHSSVNRYNLVFRMSFRRLILI